MSSEGSPAVILETRTHLVPSTVTGEYYELAVWLPPGYATTADRYPVVYILDSPYAFGLAWAAVCFRIWEGLLPEVIVVGVGAPVQNLDDWDLIRLRDYCPRPLANHQGSGRAAEFHQVLHQDLLPFVHSTYRSDPADRTLWGHSLGGTFALHVLFEEPTLFQRYIATSPAVIFDGETMVDLSADAPPVGTPLPASLFVSVGVLDDEYGPHIRAFAAALRDRAHPGLRLDLVELPDCAHASAAPAGFLAGLGEVFRASAA